MMEFARKTGLNLKYGDRNLGDWSKAPIYTDFLQLLSEMPFG